MLKENANNSTFRVLALTATPGADTKTVQKVVENLLINKIEIRTEDSLDIKPYTHNRILEEIILPMSDDIKAISDIYSNLISVFLDRLIRYNVFYEKNPRNISSWMLRSARERFRASKNGIGPNASAAMSPAQSHIIEANFGVCMSLCDNMTHLIQHGVRFFYSKLRDYAEECEKMGSKIRKEVILHPLFSKLMNHVKSIMAKPGFSSHPKIPKVVEIVLAHFVQHVDEQQDYSSTATTRAMIFSQYRDSVEEIVSMLDEHKPLIKAIKFVGQSSGKKETSSKGFTQKDQLEV